MLYIMVKLIKILQYHKHTFSYSICRLKLHEIKCIGFRIKWCLFDQVISLAKNYLHRTRTSCFYLFLSRSDRDRCFKIMLVTTVKIIRMEKGRIKKGEFTIKAKAQNGKSKSVNKQDDYKSY